MRGERRENGEERMERREEIEAEFGEPLRDVIVGMREQECTWGTIGGALGVSRSQVYLWRKELGIEDSRRLYNAGSFGPSKVEMAARRLGYRSAEVAIIDLRFGGRTLAETAEMLGVDPKTVTRHYPPGFAGLVFVKTERYVESRREWGLRAAERRRKAAVGDFRNQVFRKKPGFGR